MTKGLEDLCNGRKTEGDRSFLPQERKAQGAPHHTVFQYLKGGYEEDRVSLFLRGHMAKTSCNGYKLQGKGFHKKDFFYGKNNHPLEELPRDIAESPLPKVFHMQLDRVPDNLV